LAGHTERVPGRKHTHAVDQGLRNAYFAKRGLIFLVDLHRHATQQIVVPEPPQLALWG
jgi:hypothetical protein